MSKCQRCINFPDGSNGSGYMPCSCKSKDNLSDVDLLRQVRETLEAKPLYVEPPPLVPIGRPRLGWKPKQFKYGDSDPYKKFNILLLFILLVCMIGLGITIGMVL